MKNIVEIKKNLLMLLTSLSLCLTVADASKITVHAGSPKTAPGKLAGEELKLYMEKMFHDRVTLESKGSSFDIIVGTADNNNYIKEQGVTLPQGKNADQGYSIKTIGKSVFIVGATEIGSLYGVYAFLEEYGAYFQINGERLPEKVSFKVKALNVSETPEFKYRGLLPWDNFACGMSAFGLKDYKELIDRMVRMKFNKLQFHFYPGYAFFTEKWNGKKVLPVCIGQPVDIFKTEGSIGQAAFGDRKAFGCEEYIEHDGDPARQAEAVQEMMRKVIDYAHSRKVQVVVGFELVTPCGETEFTLTDKPSDNNGGHNIINPLLEKNVDLSVQRYRSLVETYPNADYYWLWQSEARGSMSRNVGREPGAKEFRKQYGHWAGIPNSAGDVDYAYLFKQVAERLTPQERAKLATGGWSIEHIFPQIHSDFPEDVIFASLNGYSPNHTIDSRIDSFRVAEKGRRSWMIDWWEFDGDQWFPQFRVNWQEQMYDRCREFGVEAVTLLGWKLTGVEHNVRYLSEYCWNPTLRGNDFYASYIESVYGAKSKKLERIFSDYDRYEPHSPPASAADYRKMLLGAGWMRMAVPELPGTGELLAAEAWQTIVKNTADTIRSQNENMDKDLTAIEAISEANDEFDSEGRIHARLLRNRLEFRVLYLRAMLAYNQGILVYDRVGTFEGIKAARKAVADLYKQSLDYARQAIEKYAELTPHKTDLGVIAQLNEQFYKVIELNYNKLLEEEISSVTIDWDTFDIWSAVDFDFSKPDAWAYRDGKVQIENVQDQGRDVLSLVLGNAETKFNSVSVHAAALDLEKAPIMDFKLRTDSRRPMAFLFQVEGSDEYHALNLVASHSGYNAVDTISKNIIDGAWHRVTWNLLKIFREKFSANEKPIIRNLIFGTWEAADRPAKVEFKDFTLGVENTLD